MSDEKTTIILQLLNNILTVLGNDQINNFTDFKNIKRDDLLKPEILEVVNELEPAILKYYDKRVMGYYIKHTQKEYSVNFIRKALDQLGYKLSSKKVTRRNNNVITDSYIYSIIMKA